MGDIADSVNELSLKELGGSHPLFRLATFVIYLTSLVLIFSGHMFSVPIWFSLSEKSIKEIFLDNTGIIYTVTPSEVFISLFLVFLNERLYRVPTKWRIRYLIEKCKLPERMLKESDEIRESLSKEHEYDEISKKEKSARSKVRRCEKTMTRSMEFSQSIFALLVVSVVSLVGFLARKCFTRDPLESALAFYDLVAGIVWLLALLYLEWQRLTEITPDWMMAITKKAQIGVRLKELDH